MLYGVCQGVYCMCVYVVLWRECQGVYVCVWCMVCVRECTVCVYDVWCVSGSVLYVCVWCMVCVRECMCVYDVWCVSGSVLYVCVYVVRCVSGSSATRTYTVCTITIQPDWAVCARSAWLVWLQFLCFQLLFNCLFPGDYSGLGRVFHRRTSRVSWRLLQVRAGIPQKNLSSFLVIAPGWGGYSTEEPLEFPGVRFFHRPNASQAKCHPNQKCLSQH